MFFVHSHGNEDALTVEAYPFNDEGKRARDEQFATYTAMGYKEGTESIKL
ncbi:MAG: hypothetical protein AB1630_06850 [bacterium]